MVQLIGVCCRVVLLNKNKCTIFIFDSKKKKKSSKTPNIGLYVKLPNKEMSKTALYIYISLSLSHSALERLVELYKIVSTTFYHYYSVGLMPHKKSYHWTQKHTICKLRHYKNHVLKLQL